MFTLSNFFIILSGEFAHLGLKEIFLILSILVMDAALSGDNSIAIAALAQNVPEKHRTRTIYLGMIVAAILRIFALCLASFIMSNPWVQVLGGLYLFKLCWSHFAKEEQEAEEGVKIRNSLIGTLIAIGFLDLSLSLDNVVAVVAMTPNLAVILLGVLASIAMLAVAAQLTRKLMKHYPLLEDAAYVILAFLGVVMLIEHTSEFLIWLGDLITRNHHFISNMNLKIGDLGEIIGVAAIIIFAILLDEIRKRRVKYLKTISQS